MAVKTTKMNHVKNCYECVVIVLNIKDGIEIKMGSEVIIAPHLK